MKTKGFAAPYVVWMLLFTIAPILLVLCYAFTDSSGQFTLQNFQSFLDPIYIGVLFRSIGMALLCTLICLLVGYPAAYFLANRSFDKKGVLVIERTPDSDEDEMMMTALDAGAEDMQTLDDAFEVTTDPNDFSAVREKLEAQGLSFLSAEVQMIPQNTVVPADEDTLQKVQKLLEMLEDNDDVQNVWHNAELPEEPDEE